MNDEDDAIWPSHYNLENVDYEINASEDVKESVEDSQAWLSNTYTNCEAKEVDF